MTDLEQADRKVDRQQGVFWSQSTFSEVDNQNSASGLERKVNFRAQGESVTLLSNALD